MKLKQLSFQNILSQQEKNEQESLRNLVQLPEKVLQFGTGVLLRGLPDYFVDKANKQNIFNGRIVVVKSTGNNADDVFSKQDNLFTHFIRGMQNGKPADTHFINSSVSRVLNANSEWEQVLDCAANPQMQVVISNTTEVGIVLDKEDKITGAPPKTFPGKLLAFLYQRYIFFKGDINKGMVILPTELIGANGTILEGILIELSVLNKLEDEFIKWLTTANYFCNTLVDRIVPGKPNATEQKKEEERLGYIDELMIMSEPYALWAIETANTKVNDVISFAAADEQVVITSDISKYKNLKLHLLNGTHSFTCALAHLTGFVLVKELMQDEVMSRFVHKIMQEEIAPCLAGEAISLEEAQQYGLSVEDRFKNPFIEHKWLSISMNYTQKMKMRTVPMLKTYIEKFKKPPTYMSLGFAAYLLFMRCKQMDDGNYYGECNGKLYLIQDEQAAYFSQLWKENDIAGLVKTVLANKTIWGEDLTTLTGLTESIIQLIKAGVRDGLASAASLTY